MTATRSGYENLDELEANVNETTSILKSNVNKVMERGENLENINERSERLTRTSSSFRMHSTRLRRTMWLKNRWLVASIVLIVVAIIILTIILTLKPWKK